MIGTTPPLTSKLESSKTHFTLECTIKYGQSHYTALFSSALICRVNTCMGAIWHYEHYCRCTVRTAKKYFPYTLNINIIIVGIQPLGRFGHRPELSQATGMALVRCILGKFLGVVCHYFPPGLDVPTFATRCLHVRQDVRDPSGGRWNCGRECSPVI